MAAELAVPSTGRTNRPVSIVATGFEADGTLTVSVDEIGVSSRFTLDAEGDLAAESFGFTPFETGVYTIKATDGTDTVTARIQIFSTT